MDKVIINHNYYCISISTVMKTKKCLNVKETRRAGGGGRGGGEWYSQKNWVGVFGRPSSQNPYPIYDQNLRYFLHYLRPDQEFKTLFMT